MKEQLIRKAADHSCYLVQLAMEHGHRGLCQCSCG